MCPQKWKQEKEAEWIHTHWILSVNINNNTRLKKDWLYSINLIILIVIYLVEELVNKQVLGRIWSVGWGGGILNKGSSFRFKGLGVGVEGTFK
jgi:hypothetical protein